LKTKPSASRTRTRVSRSSSKSLLPRFVKNVQTQVMAGNQKGGQRYLEEQKHNEKKEKKKAEQAQALLASLFKNAQSLSS
jgi:hypothetical protein